MAPLAVFQSHFIGKWACSVSRISVFVWTGENDSKTLHVDAIFLKTERKKIVFKRKRLHVEGVFIVAGSHVSASMFVNHIYYWSQTSFQMAWTLRRFTDRLFHSAVSKIVITWPQVCCPPAAHNISNVEHGRNEFQPAIITYPKIMPSPELKYREKCYLGTWNATASKNSFSESGALSSWSQQI